MEESVRIAVVVRGFHKHGGISRCAAELSDRFSENHEVHVFTNYFESENEKLIYHKVEPLKIRYPKSLVNTIEFGSFAVKSWHELRHFRFDIIHAHSSSCLAQDVVTAHTCHMASLIKINRLKDKSHRFNYIKAMARPFNFVNVAIEKLQYRKGNYKKIIAVSNSIKNDLIEFSGAKDNDVVVIPNGIDLEQFSPNDGERNKIRKNYGIKNEDMVVSFVSHRFANKGLDYLVEAISLVRRKEVKLLIVSGDDPKDYLKFANQLGISDQIIIFGGTKYPECAYRASDIFILPSLYEGNSLVVLEAMSVGLPVIVTNVGGAPDLISDGINGFLISTPPNPEEISEIIKTLLENEQMRKEIGGNARKTVIQYSWDNIASQTMKLYMECN